MKQSVLNAWILKLESGTIQQLKHNLGDVTGARCCLGVLCDIQGLHKEPETIYTEFGREGPGSLLEYRFDGDWNKEILPYKFWEEMDFFSGSGDHKDRLTPTFASASIPSLADLNDSGTNFAQIAYILRTEPLNYIRSIEPDVPALEPRS